MRQQEPQRRAKTRGLHGRVQHRRVHVTAILGVCAPERQRIASGLDADALLPLVHDARELVHALDEVVKAVRRPARVVVPCAAGVVPHDLLALARGGELPPEAWLGCLVTVVDAEHFLTDLTGSTSSQRTWDGEDEKHLLADVAVNQVEHCDAVVLAGWTRTPLEQLRRTMALLAHLNPAAQLTVFRSSSDWAWRMAQVRRRRGQTAGWVHVLNEQFAPSLTGYGVSAFRYRQRRPLHPGRLLALLEGDFHHRHGQLLRSAGLCAIASRPGATGMWDHTGISVALRPLSAGQAEGEVDEPRTGAATDAVAVPVGQDIALFGLELDAAGLTADLDGCALTDIELARGPESWVRLPDLLPPWPDQRSLSRFDERSGWAST